MYVHDFASAEAYLSGGKSKVDRPLENNTRLIRRSDDTIAVRLHDTDVVTYHQNGLITLNSGGWRTVTTKDRINKYAPIGLYSEKSVWWIANRNTWNKLSMFYDRMTINADGSVVEPRFPDVAAEKARKVIYNRINRYVKAYMDEFTKGMPPPGSGDCWYCLFNDQNGKNLGDATGDVGHLNDHIREKYFVPSLLYNAVKEKGYRYPEFLMGLTEYGMGGCNCPIESCRLALRQYLVRRLIPESNGSKPV